MQLSGAAKWLTAFTAVTVAVASGVAVWFMLTRDEAWARALPFAAATFALFIAAVVYEVCNPAPARREAPDIAPVMIDDRCDVATKADDLLTRIRADYTQVGANLATLLGFVATGGGVIALSSGNVTAATPLIISAAIAVLAVLLLSLLGLRPEHHSTTTTNAEKFNTWMARANDDPVSFNRCYVQDIFHKCDRYERFRRVRRAYYIYAGWCFILALAAVGLNAIHSDCSLQNAPSAVKPCADAKAAIAAKK